MNLRILSALLAVCGFAALRAAAADAPQQGIWETSLKIENYGPRDHLPSKTATRVERACATARDREAEELLKRGDQLGSLNGKCWISESRKDANRAQVKMTCADGSTAEAATRTEPDGSFGYMLVFNIPEQGALAVTATSKKIADVCTKEGTKIPGAGK